MMAQRDITASDLCDRSLDRLGHHQTRPFTMRSGLAKSSAQSDGGGKLIAKRLQLTAETSSSVAVVEPISFRQFLAQLANTLSILLAGPGVEHSACIAESCGRADLDSADARPFPVAAPSSASSWASTSRPGLANR